MLDPFAGCATTCIAAERLGRQWVGIDLNAEAAIKRLNDADITFNFKKVIFA